MEHSNNKPKKINKNIVGQAFIKTIPVLSGYMVLGMGFGIMLESNGFGIIWSLLMSGFIYAGSMQYVAIPLMVSGVNLLTAALTTVMVNGRHLFYGISMIDRYKNAGKKKPYMIFALTDETYSLVCNGEYPEGEDEHTFYFLMSLFNHSYWITGSLIGSIIGAAISFNTAGIDFCMTALFVTVVVEQWLSTKQHLPAIIGFAGSLICLIIFGADSFMIPSMIVITAALTASRRYLEKYETSSAATAHADTDEISEMQKTTVKEADKYE